MARYLFHLREGQDVLRDPDGRDLDDLSAVLVCALREARSLISADALAGHINLDQQIEVENSRGVVVHRLRFTDAVVIISAPAA